MRILEIMLSATQILILEQVPGVGRSSIIAINDYLTSQRLTFPERDKEIIELFTEAKKEIKRLKVPILENIALAKEASDEICEKSDSNGIKIISCFDLNFPPLLKSIKNKPLLLHCKGNLKSLELPTVAIIGTREPSAHAISAGPKLSSYFVKAGFTIVSGLAIGCDTIGHKKALESNSPTVAVMAGGLHSCYPKENKHLANEILDRGGLLVSELPYGKNPHKSTFVDRDRLQSGLSLGVVVLETGIKGGTLHTVGFAIEEDRPVACMYSHTSSTGEYARHEKFQGNKMLVEEGKAFKMDSVESIEEYIQKLLNLDKSAIGSSNNLSNGNSLSLNNKGLSGASQLSFF